MNVLYLHQHFATRAGTGGTRSYEFSQHLLQRGHTVTMVAGRRQGGGYGMERHQQIDGIDVICCGSWYSNRLSPLRRLWSFARFTFGACTLRTKKLGNRPDVVFATSTPLTIGIPGVLLARRLRVPLVFEVRDLWPEAPIGMGVLKNPVVIRLARALERWIYRNARHVIALSPGMAGGVQRGGVVAEHISTIPNASDVELFTPEHRDRAHLEPWGVGSEFVAIHAGSMGAANGLMYVVEAAKILAQRKVDGIRILIAGDGGTRPKLESKVAEYGLTNVTFMGSLQRHDMGNIVPSCDAAITSFLPLEILKTNSPNKLFDGLSSGIPNIVNSAGWTKELVERANAGLYVDATQPAELADALIRLQENPGAAAEMGRNARSLACEKFDRAKLATEFVGVLEQAVQGVVFYEDPQAVQEVDQESVAAEISN